MPVFTPSTIPWVTAVQLIADSAGASADTEMTTRAHHSLRAAFQYFGNKVRWDFLRGEGRPITLVAPFSVALTASAGQSSAVAVAGHGVLVDDLVIGSGFVLGTRVSATAAASISFATTITGFGAGATPITVSAQRDMYDVPSDFRRGYSFRLLSSNSWIPYVGRRLWDRTISDEFAAGTVERYDFFHLGGKGKARFLPPPGAAGVAQQRYFRRFTLASASSVTSNLDIPEDYESYLIAWGKWYFLTDKDEGRRVQAGTWLSLAEEGLKTMIADQTNLPDEDLAFIPGHSQTAAIGDKTTRAIDWEYGR